MTDAAELLLDGKAFQPDGRSAATLLPAAFGLAGVNLHTYTGWGSITTADFRRCEPSSTITTRCRDSA
jgi:hypothetical protein